MEVPELVVEVQVNRGEKVSHSDFNLLREWNHFNSLIVSFLCVFNSM